MMTAMMIGQIDGALELRLERDYLNLKLRPEIERLRDAALSLQSSEVRWIPAVPLIDATSWSQHGPDEDWLIGRARRAAARLRQLPISLSPGESIVGRPELRPRTPEEVAAIEDAQEILATIIWIQKCRRR